MAKPRRTSSSIVRQIADQKRKIAAAPRRLGATALAARKVVNRNLAKSNGRLRGILGKRRRSGGS